MIQDTQSQGVILTDVAGRPAIAVPEANGIPLVEPVRLRAGQRIGDVRIVALSDNAVELRTPGELGWGLGLVGAVPVVWCLLAWVLCVREGLLSERLPGCLVLTAIAIVSAVLMVSCLGIDWRFERRTKEITRRIGPFHNTHKASEVAGLRLEAHLVGVAPFVDQMLLMNVVDHDGKAVLEIEEWNRREVDRAKVDALASAIRKVMDWSEPKE